MLYQPVLNTGDLNSDRRVTWNAVLPDSLAPYYTANKASRPTTAPANVIAVPVHLNSGNKW